MLIFIIIIIIILHFQCAITLILLIIQRRSTSVGLNVFLKVLTVLHKKPIELQVVGLLKKHRLQIFFKSVFCRDCTHCVRQSIP